MRKHAESIIAFLVIVIPFALLAAIMVSSIPGEPVEKKDKGVTLYFDDGASSYTPPIEAQKQDCLDSYPDAGIEQDSCLEGVG